jgi:glycosyltransferase involved in cell wall biosynthesis
LQRDPAAPRTINAVIVAYSADPTSSDSVPLIGYRVAKGIGQFASITLVAHRQDSRALADVVPPERLRLAGSARLAAALRKVTTSLLGVRWPLISIFELPDYLLFDVQAFLVVRRLLRRQRVDYVLRVNPVSFRFPSLLPRLPVPVFTGPHNGGMEWPPAFAHVNAKEHTGQQFRFVGDLLHRLYGDSRRYAGIFAAHEMCVRTVPAADRGRVILFAENGVERIPEPSRWAGDATRLLYVGRLTPFKAVDVAVRALSQLPAQVRLTIVGDGPQRRELEELAAQLGVAGRCNFTGAVPHASLEQYYSAAGVFVFPSVRESGGAVVLEAMSYALPCLVANWGGPAIYTRDTGVHMRVDSPAVLEGDLVKMVTHFLANPALARRTGQRSREVVRSEFLWNRKAERLHQMMTAGSERAREDVSLVGKLGQWPPCFRRR